MNRLQSFLATSLVLLSTSAFGATVSNSTSVAPVPAPTVINSAPYTISSSGFYQLGADLTYAGNSSIANDAIITINANNVILDFGGHYISGPSTNSATTLNGVYANEHSNLTIQNGTVSHCPEGIYLVGNGQSGSLNINQRVDNMVVTHCSYNGIYFVFPTNSDVLNCRVSFIGSTQASSIGIYTYGATGISLINNEVTSVTCTSGGNAYGIQNNSPSGVFALGNRVVECQFGISGTKYQNNLTSGCTTPFSNGTDAGGNN